MNNQNDENFQATSLSNITNSSVITAQSCPDSIDGKDGADGRSPVLQSAPDYIQWKYPDETDWNNLASVKDLKGDPGSNGQDGNDGQSPILQEGSTSIQWKYPDDEQWQDIVDITELKGNPGDDGANGATGKSPILQKGDSSIQWKYPDDAGWQEITDIASLKGATGRTGYNGINGSVSKFYYSNIYKYFRPGSADQEINLPLHPSVYNSTMNIIGHSGDGTELFLPQNYCYMVVISFYASGDNENATLESYTYNESDNSQRGYIFIQSAEIGVSTCYIETRGSIKLKVITKSIEYYFCHFAIIILGNRP